MKNSKLNFSIALVTVRQYSGLTQQEAAKRAKVSQGYLSALEQGHKTPSMHTLQCLAEIYGTPVWQVVFLAETALVTAYNV